ncbi:hypothetical protein [Accumulibacter sp.]|uniref:hypothetical protein n=1 Tax=Accumulibacter sp. TaxID=2053492 RepID=UPI001A61EE26|nr:hypothetical protein [Accumulibacter sp.]MBL8373797.1 hypothetical protein [Accumulibacter sp.]
MASSLERSVTARGRGFGAFFLVGVVMTAPYAIEFKAWRTSPTRQRVHCGDKRIGAGSAFSLTRRQIVPGEQP